MQIKDPFLKYPDDITNQVRSDLSPILDVFGGVDGGGAFARLQHEFLNEMYSKTYPTEAEAALVKMVKQFSRLCALMLEK